MTAAALRRFRLILWALVAVAAVGATALYVLKPPQGPGEAALSISDKPFSLQSTTGGTFTQADLKGTPSLVFFGYTNCPDVCPTTLAESAQWKQELGLTGKDLRTIFVTVDPTRDTAEVLKQYLSTYPDVVGLVGTATETEAAKGAFGVFSENKAPDSSGFYLVNHTANVFLIGRQGEFEGTIAYGEDKDVAEGKIKRLVQS